MARRFGHADGWKRDKAVIVSQEEIPTRIRKGCLVKIRTGSCYVKGIVVNSSNCAWTSDQNVLVQVTQTLAGQYGRVYRNREIVKVPANLLTFRK